MTEAAHQAPAQTGAVLEKTARGTGWVIGWRMATRLLGLMNTIILVRLLVPGDFGLVALGASLTQAVEAFGFIGLEDALIREKTPDKAMYNTAFTLGLLRSAATASVVALMAGPAAGFFGEPRLRQVVLALAAGLFLDGLDNIGTVDFRRNFAFRTEFVLWIMPRIASVAASITVALIWRSYWALLVGILTNRVLRLVLSYVMHPFRPRLALSAWRHLLGYSSWSWVLALMSILRDKTPTILIGRMLGATQVGLFSLGFELASLPTTELVEPLTRAAFSAFSATRHHALEAGETYVRMVSAMALLTIPSGIGITLIADPVVRLAFGPHWTGAVPVVQLLGLCGALTVFGALSNSAFRVYGEMRLIFRVSMVVEAVRIVLLLWLTWRYGLMGAAVATSAAFAVEQVYFLILTQARFAIASRLLAGRLWRIFAATLCMAAVLRWTGAATALPVGAGSGALAVQAAGAALLGAVTYGASLLVLWLASGRAPGAEADLLRMVRRAARPVFARWRPA